MMLDTLRKSVFPALAAWLLLCSGAKAGGFLLLTREEAAAIRDSIRQSKPETDALAKRLRKEADRAMLRGPWTVTRERPKDVPGLGKQDFYSEGPYWWPDPAHPGGPFIRRDGERYPGRFVANDNDMGEMCDAVFALGMASYFLSEPGSASRAAKVLSVWFLEESTRMTPHLEFGQAIRGVTTGRGTGIIDTCQLIRAVQGMMFLENSDRGPEDTVREVKSWFSRYLEWLTTSKKGLDEKKSGNNHATWWTAQVAAYATFVEDRDRLAMAWSQYRNYLVPHQIRGDGSCPLEEARTNSLGYSSMNLNGFSILCRIAEVNGEALWAFRTPDGLSLGQAVRYLTPFIMDPGRWKKKQIQPYKNGNAYFLLLSGLGLGKPEYSDLYCQLSPSDDLLRLEWELLAASRKICTKNHQSQGNL